MGFYNRLLDAREKYGDIAVVHDTHGDYTYSELLSGADDFCSRLLDIGLKPGDHVGLCSYNSARWIMSYIGIVKAGGVAVLLNYSLPIEELAEFSKDMDCKFFLYGNCLARSRDSDFVDKIQVDDDKKVDINALSVKMKTSFERCRISEEELFSPSYIIFTSGSSGKPKGAMLSQNTGIRGADDFLERHPEAEGEKICIVSPLFHNFALIVALAHLLYGGMCILPETFRNDDMFRMIDECEPAAIGAIMTLITRLIGDSRINDKASHCIRRIYTGGAPILPIHVIRIEKTFDNISVLADYGQTEVGFPIAAVCAGDSYEKKTYTVGRPLHSRILKIMSPDGTECKPNEPGEVTLFNNGYMTCGYYNAPEAIDPIDENGYLHTGDLGFLDEEGYLHLSGRIKEIIIKGGENITPVAIEKEILSIEGINSVKVMGAPNDLYGESVEACISYSEDYLKTNVPYSDAELKTLLKGKISSFQVPSHFFHYSEFPAKSNGKVDVLKLHLMMLHDLGRCVVEDEIKSGISILNISAMSQKFIIEPVCDSVEKVMGDLGFSKKKSLKIRLVVEELLIERTHDTILESGNMTLEFRLWKDFLRISFSDEGSLFNLTGAVESDDKSGFSESLRIIAAMSDRISIEQKEGGAYIHNLDFCFDKEFDVEDFIVES